MQQLRLSCLSTLLDPPSTFQHALFCYFSRQFRLFRDANDKKPNDSNDGEEAPADSVC